MSLQNMETKNSCAFSNAATKALAGKDILLAIYNTDGSKLLAISGQQGLTINRSAESIEITSKDTEGGWKSKIAGMKEWSIDNDGLYVPGDESHTLLSQAFDHSEPVCVKIINGKTKTGMFGGMAVITDYPLEAPFDDAMTYSLTLEGMGALVDLLVNPEVPDTMPEGSPYLDALTVVSVAGTAEGKSAVYVNPVKTNGNVYKYQIDTNVSYPSYDADCSAMTDWDGTAELTAASGQEILIVECTAELKARKAGKAVATVKENEA